MNAPWLKFLGWSELLAGGAGLVTLVLGAPNAPVVIPAWHTALATSFLGTSALGGFLLLRAHPSGVRLSIPVQALQLVGFSVGWRFVARAGFYVTAVLASTGFGFLGGAGGEFIAADAVDGQLSATGLGFGLSVGFWPGSLKAATATLGFNLLALYFLVQLLRVQRAQQQGDVQGPAV